MSLKSSNTKKENFDGMMDGWAQAMYMYTYKCITVRVSFVHIMLISISIQFLTLIIEYM